jgi:hypothetical protein
LKMEITDVEYDLDEDKYNITISFFEDDDTLLLKVSRLMSLDELKHVPDYPLIEKLLVALKNEKEAGLN